MELIRIDFETIEGIVISCHCHSSLNLRLLKTRLCHEFAARSHGLSHHIIQWLLLEKDGAYQCLFDTSITLSLSR